MALPLPHNHYAPGLWHNAYQCCIEFETYAQQDPGPVRRSQTYLPTRVVCARLLGYLIREAPTSEGRNNVSREIRSADSKGYSALEELAKFYMQRLLRCCEYLLHNFRSINLILEYDSQVCKESHTCRVQPPLKAFIR